MSQLFASGSQSTGVSALVKVEGFGIVNKAEIDAFLELSCFFQDPADVGSLIFWTVKNAEGQRIDAFELWCWRRLLRVLLTTGRSNQSILKEISPGISLEGMMLKLKLQYFGHIMQRVDSLEKTLMLGGIGGRRRKGTTEDEMAGWHHQLDGREFE